MNDLVPETVEVALLIPPNGEVFFIPYSKYKNEATKRQWQGAWKASFSVQTQQAYEDLHLPFTVVKSIMLSDDFRARVEANPTWGRVL